jgi:phosphoribosylformimino-5-aminoimidazole carboxamide ribotide isomerase
MRVIGVLDLAAGGAVHAVAGRRDRYRAVRSCLVARPGDAAGLARAYRDVLALRDVYVADLDAIVAGAPQRALLRAVARAAAPARVLVDAGIANVEQARRALADGATHVVVGLETLPSIAALETVVRGVGGERVIFSLDLRDGEPVIRAGAEGHPDPLVVADRAAGTGVSSILVLDVARVGTGRGVDLALVRGVRRVCPAVAVLVGGGVRDRAELEALAAADVDGVLVATALHDGRLTVKDVEALRAERRSE